MSSEWKKRRRRAESVAEDAWDHLQSAFDNARSGAQSFGGSVKDRAADLADGASSRYSSAAGRVSSVYGTASDRAGSAGNEAWNRANQALDALSGRKPRKPWGWIAVAVLGGIAVGWAVAASAPKAIQAAQDRFSEEEPDELPAVYETPAPYQAVPPTS